MNKLEHILRQNLKLRIIKMRGVNSKCSELYFTNLVVPDCVAGWDAAWSGLWRSRFELNRISLFVHLLFVFQRYVRIERPSFGHWSSHAAF